MDEVDQLKQEIEHLRESLKFYVENRTPSAEATALFETWVKRISLAMREEAHKVKESAANGYW